MDAKLNASISIIDTHNLRGVDLNLLVAFVALMDTRSVTRAAELLCIGQPSASHALKRLRDLLGDPLFVRCPHGMAPTPRALALEQPIRDVLASISATLFEGAMFDPGTARRNFRVGASDYAQIAIAEGVLAWMAKVAPACRLILTAADCDTVGRSLDRGDIDCAVGAFPALSWASHQQVLYTESYLCLFDSVACGIEGVITQDQWLGLPHAIMSTRGDLAGPLDEMLAKRGLARHVAVSTPHFLAIPWLLKGKRLIAALPGRLALRCAAAAGLTACPLPFATPGFPVSMVWNARTDAEPGNRWLREAMTRQCSA